MFLDVLCESIALYHTTIPCRLLSCDNFHATKEATNVISAASATFSFDSHFSETLSSSLEITAARTGEKPNSLRVSTCALPSGSPPIHRQCPHPAAAWAAAYPADSRSRHITESTLGGAGAMPRGLRARVCPQSLAIIARGAPREKR